ncbi:vacuolar-sorting protein SNF7 [Irpex rosettiformis]|uniref:Vacuolar-sorting protein SNF7 n=1 Tax=Irpex rosettiformis TaxID=378272 RepID=A0ACB8U4B5_9APHY|nr:vacuolar-sorting protein SNF7 [Irpex rosettiformis]
MMAGFMSYFGGRRDAKQSSRDAIVTLRQQLQMLEKKEEHLQKRIDEDLKKAKANAVANKGVATAALKSKKAKELELERLQGTRFQLEMQINTLESASFNAETMSAMKKASNALKDIHGTLNIDKVDATMADIQEQTQLANEVSEAISTQTYAGIDIDDDELKRELADLEQDELNERLAGADHVPIHHPAGASRAEDKSKQTEEEDEEAELKRLQAELAM